VSRPRILLTTDLVGGVWDFCLVLARALDARVTVLALGEETTAHADAAVQAGADIVFAPLKLEWMRDADADVARTGEVVARLAQQIGVDFVHANQFAAVVPNAPTVLTLHSDVLSWRRWTLGASEAPPEWNSYAALVKQALKTADRVVGVSSFLANQVHDLYGCRREIEVIHNGWPASIAPARRERFTLLAGRAWDAAKNIQLAARAAHGWNPGPVFVAGNQRHPESGAAMPIDSPLQPLGHLAIDELQAWLSRASIYLSPARYDPFGLLPLQAALNGAALLLSDIPSYRELWDGVACFFHSDDPDDLRWRWQRLLDNRVQIDALAAGARARALERYSVERMADAYARVYASTAVGVAA